jgi:hypothetical protein
VIIVGAWIEGFGKHLHDYLRVKTALHFCLGFPLLEDHYFKISIACESSSESSSELFFQFV